MPVCSNCHRDNPVGAMRCACGLPVNDDGPTRDQARDELLVELLHELRRVRTAVETLAKAAPCPLGAPEGR